MVNLDYTHRASVQDVGANDRNIGIAGQKRSSIARFSLSIVAIAMVGAVAVAVAGGTSTSLPGHRRAAGTSNNEVLVLALDRSGSMHSFGDEVLEGSKNYLAERRRLADDAGSNIVVSVITFDARSERPISGVDIRRLDDEGMLKKEHVHPRGATALHDAFHDAIMEADRLAEGLEGTPARVEILVFTDGEENASNRATKEQVRKLTDARRAERDYVFTFLAANQDAMATGRGYGIKDGESLTMSSGHEHVSAGYGGAAARSRHYYEKRDDADFHEATFDDLSAQDDGENVRLAATSASDYAAYVQQPSN